MEAETSKAGIANPSNTKQPGSLPIVLTVTEVAHLLRISRGAAYSAVRRGDLPSIRLGHRILIPTARILESLGEVAQRKQGES